MLLKRTRAAFERCKDMPKDNSPHAELCAQLTATISSMVTWLSGPLLRPMALDRVLPLLCRIDGAQTSCAAAECLVQLAGRSYKAAEDADLLLGAMHACMMAAQQGRAVSAGKPLFGAGQRGASAPPAVLSFLGDACAEPARPDFFARHSIHALCFLCTRQAGQLVQIATGAATIPATAVGMLRSIAGRDAASAPPAVVGAMAVASVLRALLAVLEHPCQTFASLAPQGIEAILRQCRTVTWNDSVLARPECPGLKPRLPSAVAAIMPQVCRALARVMTKDVSFAYMQANPMGGGDTPQPPPETTCTFLHGQVDGLGEYQQALSTIRSHAGRLLQVCGASSPASATQALTAMANHLAVPLSQTKPNDGLELAAGGGRFASKASSSYVALEAATLATQHLASGLPEEAVKPGSPLLPALGAVAEAWCERVKSPDPRLDGQCMKGAVSLWRVTMHNRKLL